MSKGSRTPKQSLTFVLPFHWSLGTTPSPFSPCLPISTPSFQPGDRSPQTRRSSVISQDHVVVCLRPPASIFVTSPPSDILHEEVLITEQTSHRTSVPISDGHGFHFFTVPKKDGGIQLIMDLGALNKLKVYLEFWMTSLQSFLPLLKQWVWMATIDPKDAYFHRDIRAHHRQYLCFIMGVDHYKYKVLMFRISTAP